MGEIDPRLDPAWPGEAVYRRAEAMRFRQWWPRIEVPETARSKAVRWLGVIASFYFFGEIDTATAPEPPLRPTEFCCAVLSSFEQGLQGADRQEIEREVEQHAQSLGIPSLRALEWMLHGWYANWLDGEVKRLSESPEELARFDQGHQEQMAGERLALLYGKDVKRWTGLLKANRDFAAREIDKQLSALREPDLWPLGFAIRLFGFAEEIQGLAIEFQSNVVEALGGPLTGRPPALTEGDRQAARAYWLFHVHLGRNYDRLRRALFPDMRRTSAGDANRPVRRLIDGVERLLRLEALPSNEEPWAGRAAEALALLIAQS